MAVLEAHETYALEFPAVLETHTDKLRSFAGAVVGHYESEFRGGVESPKQFEADMQMAFMPQSNDVRTLVSSFMSGFYSRGYETASSDPESYHNTVRGIPVSATAEGVELHALRYGRSARHIVERLLSNRWAVVVSHEHGISDLLLPSLNDIAEPHVGPYVFDSIEDTIVLHAVRRFSANRNVLQATLPDTI